MTAELATRTLGQLWPENQTTVRSEAPARERRILGGRAQLLAAFGKLGVVVDENTAQTRTVAWYRSSGADWTRALD